jgi:hypothetical protein
LINSASNPTAKSITVARGGPASQVTLSLFDSVSYACGTGDGFTFCGARSFIVQKKDNAPLGIITSATNAAT